MKIKFMIQALLDQLIVIQLTGKFLAFVEPESGINPYTEPIAALHYLFLYD
jgi:hypothetical protein